MKKFRKFVSAHWRQFGLVVLAESIAACLLAVNLRGLPPSLGPTEQLWSIASSNIHIILSHPTDLPYKLLLLASRQLFGDQPLLAMRLPSVLLGMIAISLFLYILHRWYGRRSTIFGFVLLASSAWFLHTGRIAGPGIEYIAATITLLALHIALQDHEESTPMLFLWLGGLLSLITIPGAVWLVTVSLIWQWRSLVHAWLHIRHLWARIWWSALAATSIAAIAAYALYAPSIIIPWLGVPAHIPSFHALLVNLLSVVQAYSYLGPQNAEWWLGRLPLVDIFTLTMFTAGTVFYARHWLAGRTHLLASYLIVSVIISSFLGTIGLGLILPLVYVIAIAGIAYITQFWLKTFPRNPVARGFGLLLVCAVVGLSCIYNGTQYFIAWPHNPDTATVYRTR